MSRSYYEDGILIVMVGDVIQESPFIANSYIKGALDRNEPVVFKLWRLVDIGWMFAAFDGVFERYDLAYVYATVYFECELGMAVEFQRTMYLCAEYWQRTCRAAAWERAA